MSKELISAIKNKDNEKVSELSEGMEAGEINKVVGGTTALHIACAAFNDQALDKLLNKTGIDINIKNASGWTPLHTAADVNNVHAISRLLTSPGIQVNSITRSGTTPVMLSARKCHVEILEMMLKDPRVDLDAKHMDGDGLEEMVGSWCGREEEKETCQKMIRDEKMKRKSGPIEQQPIQDGSIGRRIEKVDRLNEQIEEEEEKVKRNVEISEQKMKKLKRQQSFEAENLAKKRKEEETKLGKKLEEEGTQLAKKHKEEETQLAKKRKEEETQLAKKSKEEETQLAKKHKEEDTQLEMTIKIEAEANQRYIGLLREQRDEQVRELQKSRIDPAQDASEDRHKLEDALNKQEAAKRALECPVCLDFMRPPTKIWMCEKSHLICEACKDKLEGSDLLGGGKCPTCTTQPITLRAHKSEEFATIIFN